MRERPAPRAKGLARDDAILMIDQSGPTTAFVKARCQIPPRYFTDYLEGNVYFKGQHEKHNLARALVQFKLTESIEAQETALQAIIRELR